MINDVNHGLTNAYMQVRDNVEYLIESLKRIQQIHWSLAKDDKKAFYDLQRYYYNCGISSDKFSQEDLGVLFIFLNKTCYNGLYRVNSQGEFNASIGSYGKPTICDADHLRRGSQLLQGVKITHGDYSQTKNFIDKDTFVYLDPPYRQVGTTVSFTSYSQHIFADQQQIELKNFVDEISSRGASVIESNSDPKNTDPDDNFFDDLYKQYHIQRVSTTWTVNRTADGRGSINELLIYN